jgi:hypothetical protein
MERPINAQIAAQQLLFRYRVARMAYLKGRNFGRPTVAGDFVFDLRRSPIITADDDAHDFYRAVFHGEPTDSIRAGDLNQIRQWVLRAEGELPHCLRLIGTGAEMTLTSASP